MIDIIGRKKIFFLISLLILIPGTVSLLLYGLNLSIDFTGGTRFTISFPKNIETRDTLKVRTILNAEKIKVSSIEPSGKLMFVRTEPIAQNKNVKLRNEILSAYKSSNIEQFETIGPTIGKEITVNALKAIVIASVLIVLYITYVFRKVPYPANSLSFGVSAVIALLHDVLVVLGIFSILGRFLNVEVDSLFVTAVLTVIGFSVHDTIVVFDRIRENLTKDRGTSFAEVVNNSILQTLTRSINTSLTVVLVLFTLLLFGGETIRWFVVALLVGIISGTYSSIFNASPILVVWHEWRLRRKSLSNKS